MTVSETDLLNRVPRQLFIGGAWVDSSTGTTLDVHDPATDRVIAAVSDASVEDGAAALDAAPPAW